MNVTQKNLLGTYLFLYTGADYMSASIDVMKDIAEKTVSGKHLTRFTLNEKYQRKAYEKAWKDYEDELRKELSKIDRLMKLLAEISKAFDTSHPQFQEDYEAVTDLFDKLHITTK